MHLWINLSHLLIESAHELLPHVHLVDSLVKRWINGTHQGNISPKYLSYYLDEFAFRFNRKLSTYRGKLFYRLMQQAVDTSPKPFKELIKEAWPKGISSFFNLYAKTQKRKTDMFFSFASLIKCCIINNY